MAKKSAYVCQSCGANYGKWSGQCADCGEWNTLVEAPNVAMPHHKKTAKSTPKTANYAGDSSGVMTLSNVGFSLETRMPTGLGEFDRVLGGGLVAGSVVLIGGDPGIGKSTILLQTAINMASSGSLSGSALYITGEELIAGRHACGASGITDRPS